MQDYYFTGPSTKTAGGGLCHRGADFAGGPDFKGEKPMRKDTEKTIEKTLKNTLKETLEKCQELIGYRFTDLKLLSLALTHSSVAPSRVESNERLEFLGDSVLGMIVCRRLYDLPDKLPEGEMTKIKSFVVSRRTCSKIANNMELHQLASFGKGMFKRGHLPLSVTAALFETIIGAIYLDGGLEAAANFILPLVEPHIEKVMNEKHSSDYKSMLQQHLQQGKNPKPDYRLLDEKGPSHSKCFEIALLVGSRQFPSAWGNTKKAAEQKAAKLALEELGLLGNTPSEIEKTDPRSDNSPTK